jgi:hypothetical protein
MSDNNQPIPDFLFGYVQQARDLLGVGGAEWHITAKMSDKPGGKESTDGTCSYDYRYLNASLEFNTRLEDGSAAREIALHEVGHIALSEIEEAFLGALKQVPEDRQDFFRELFDDAEERFLQRLSRSLVYHARLDKLNRGDIAAPEPQNVE